MSPKPIPYSQYNTPYPRAPTSSSITSYSDSNQAPPTGPSTTLAHPVPHQPIGSAQPGGPGAGYMGMNLNMGLNMAAVGMNANGLAANLGGVAAAAGLGPNVGMPQGGSAGGSVAGSVTGAQDDEKIYALVIHLMDPETRDTALLELSKKREQYDDLALVLWHSFGMFYLFGGLRMLTFLGGV